MASSDRLSIFRSRQFAPTTNPPAGSNFLYPKADGKWYTRDSAGVETLVGGSSGLPTYAGARSNPFNPATSWYNLTPATQHIIRANLAKADVQRVRITAMGHSMLAGAFASQVGSTDTVATLRRYLGGLGANIGGTGVVKIANNTTLDYRWVLTGTWSRPNGSAPNDTADPFATATAANSTATFTSDMPGTVVDVHTFDNTASMQIYVDDVLMETYAPAGTGANVTRTYTGLANTKHVVKIIATTATSTYIVGVNVRKTVGVEVSNMGQAGSSAADWAAGVNYINRQVAMADAPPHIAILQLDTNEVLFGGPTPVATYKTNYGNLIAAIQATGAAVIMIASPPATGGTGANGYPAVSQATWETYVTAEYDLADQYGVPLLDLNHLFISQATASTDGLWGDPIHPNDYGYGLVARSLGQVAFSGQSNDKAAFDAPTLGTEYISSMPAVPASGVTLFSRFRARRMPAFVGPTGQDTHLQPALFSNMTTWMKAINAATTPSVDGLAVTHINGSTAVPSTRTVASGIFFNGLVRYGCSTQNTSNTGAGTRTNSAQWQLSSTANQGGFFFVARFGFTILTNNQSRAFVGLSATTTALLPNADPSTLFNQIGFGFDSLDNNLQFIRNDASGVSTKVDLGANFARAAGAGRDFYEVRLFAPSGGGLQLYWCAIRLNDNYVVQGGPVTTKIPAVGTLLAAHFHLSNGTSGASNGLDIQSLYIESDN